MSKPIIVTEELADKLWYAIAQDMHEATAFKRRLGSYKWNDLAGGRTGDDPGDYWCSRITIFQDMFEMRWDEDPIPDLTAYLNTPADYDVPEITLPSGKRVTPLGLLACDGIPDAFYELDCPALPKDE